MADAYMAEHPNVTIKITVMENEAFKAALQTNLQAGDVARPVPVVGRRRARASRSRPDRPGHHRRVFGLRGSANLSQAGVGLFNVDGVQYGVPVRPGGGGLLVQQGPVRRGRHRRHRRRRGTELLTDVQTLQGRRHHPDRRRCRRQVAGALLVRVPDDPPRRGGRLMNRQIADGVDWDAAPFDRGRRAAEAPRRHGTVPGGLPGGSVGRPDGESASTMNESATRRWT